MDWESENSPGGPIYLRLEGEERTRSEYSPKKRKVPGPLGKRKSDPRGKVIRGREDVVG